MRLGAMQPYFFPYLGYFDLIYNTDCWIVFDVSKYIRHGWMNRNRILHPCTGDQYINVPLKKHASKTPINEILISSDQDWKTPLFRSLEHYQKQAPYYQDTMSFVESCLSIDEQLLYKLNIHILEKVCSLLKIPFVYSIFSEMNLELGPIKKSGDWAIMICKSLGASTYINPPGGRRIYDPKEFQENGIHLIIREFPNMVYSVGSYTFKPALSIIDVLMWKKPGQIKHYLQQNRFEK